MRILKLFFLLNFIIEVVFLSQHTVHFTCICFFFLMYVINFNAQRYFLVIVIINIVIYLPSQYQRNQTDK